jgi:hypothetical protein
VYLNVKHEIAFIDALTGGRRVLASFPRREPGAFLFLVADEAHLYAVRDAPGRPPALCRIPKGGGEAALVAELPGDAAPLLARLAIHGDHLYWRTYPRYERDPGDELRARRAEPGRSWRAPRLGGPPEELPSLPEPLRTAWSSGTTAPRQRPVPRGRVVLFWRSDLLRAALGARITGRSRWLRPRVAVELVEAPSREGPLAVRATWEVDREHVTAVDADQDGVYAIVRRPRWLRASINELIKMPAGGGGPEVLARWTTPRGRNPWTEIRLSPAYVYWRLDRQIVRLARGAAGRAA